MGEYLVHLAGRVGFCPECAGTIGGIGDIGKFRCQDCRAVYTIVDVRGEHDVVVKKIGTWK